MLLPLSRKHADHLSIAKDPRAALDRELKAMVLARRDGRPVRLSAVKEGKRAELLDRAVAKGKEGVLAGIGRGEPEQGAKSSQRNLSDVVLYS